MNDNGKTIKTLLRVKSDYKLVRGKRCARVTFDLELADKFGNGDIGFLMGGIRHVQGRVVDALANEFLP